MKSDRGSNGWILNRQQFGGRYIARGSGVRRLEGRHPIRRPMVLEYPSADAAQRFYDTPEHQPILKIRLASTKSDAVLAEGYPA